MLNTRTRLDGTESRMVVRHQVMHAKPKQHHRTGYGTWDDVRAGTLDQRMRKETHDLIILLDDDSFESTDEISAGGSARTARRRQSDAVYETWRPQRWISYGMPSGQAT